MSRSTRTMRPTPSRQTLARVAATLLIALGSYALLLSLATPADACDGAPVAVDDAAAVAQDAWSDAFAAIARQADAGSVDAARLALDMLRRGPSVYGERFVASPQQVLRWRRRLACAEPPCIALA